MDVFAKCRPPHENQRQAHRHRLVCAHIARGRDDRAHATQKLPGARAAPSRRHVVDEVEWRTHGARALENLLVWPHLPFVPATAIGRESRASLTGMVLGPIAAPARVSGWFRGSVGPSRGEPAPCPTDAPRGVRAGRFSL